MKTILANALIIFSSLCVAPYSLAENSVEFTGTYKGEVSRNLSGGNRVGTAYLENLDLKLAIDADKALGWTGTSFFFYGLGDKGSESGNTPSSFVGDAQATSNIETTVDDFILYEAWVQQNYFEDKLSFLFGLHDLNSEFYVTESSLLFLNASFGIGADLAQTGDNGPSIFPVTAPALRVRYETPQDHYLQVAAYQAVAGDPVNPKGTRFILDSSDGYLLIAEVAKFHSFSEETAKYALGVWGYTKEFDRLDGLGQATSTGGYILVDQPLSKDLSIFFRHGVASTQTNAFASNTAAGVVFKNVFQRENDSFGIAMTAISAGDEYIDSLSPSQAVRRQEIAYELSYRLEVRPWLSLQPDYQYVNSPINSTGDDFAHVGTLRVEVNF